MSTKYRRVSEGIEMNNRQAKKIRKFYCEGVNQAGVSDVDEWLAIHKRRVSKYRWAVYLLSCAVLILAVGWFLEAIA